MNRYLTIPEEDILSDPEAAANVILHAVRRKIPYRFQAIVPLGETILVTLSRSSEGPYPDQFIFAPFRSCSADAVASEINSREQAGQNILSSFFINSVLWGFYAVYAEEEEMV